VVPICAGDDLRNIAVSEDPNAAEKGGSLFFTGDSPVRTADGVVEFDLGPSLIAAASAAGLRAEPPIAFRVRPATFRDFGMLWVTTGKTQAWVRIKDLPTKTGDAWLMAGDVSAPKGTVTTPADGEATINSWCADQRAAASGK
jgi:hypothetical protein